MLNHRMQVNFAAVVLGPTLGPGVVGKAEAQKSDAQTRYRKAAFGVPSSNHGPILATAKGDRPVNRADVQRLAGRADFIADRDID